jgi:hypothetical protein
VARVTRLGDFSPTGLLLEANYDFLKRRSSPKNGKILGYFLFKQIYYIFTQTSSFKTWFVVRILTFQKCFVVDVDVLAFFGLETVLYF